MTRRPLASMLRAVRSLARNGAGVAAIEFALVMPILLSLFLGTFELTNLLLASSKLTTAAQTAADLVAQQKSVAKADITNYGNAAREIMAPFAATPLGLAYASVTFDAAGKPTLAWHDEDNAPAIVNPTSLVAGLGAAGESVVIVQVRYAYASPISFVLQSSYSLSDTAFRRPRLVPAVACNAC
jgi:Flp pilus assembly protein TadG